MNFAYGQGPSTGNGFHTPGPNINKMTMGRLLKSHRLYLNKSNTKWVNIGIACVPKIAFPESAGFAVEVHLCSNNQPPFVIQYDEKVLRGLFKTIRSDNECQYISVGTRSEYNDIVSCDFQLNKINVQGTRCIQFFHNGQHTNMQC